MPRRPPGTARAASSLGKLVAAKPTMLHIPVVLGYRPRLACASDEMWSEGRYDYERLPRERFPPRTHPSDGYHRLVNIVPKRPPLLEKRPPLLEKRPPLLERPDEGSYSRYYSHVDYRDYGEGRSFSHDRRSGPSHRGDESGYRWTRDDHSASRQPVYRDMRDGFRRKGFYSSHYSRERSPHKRDAPFFRESPVGRKDSPHSRSGSSVSSRSYSPERKTYSFHQSLHRKPSCVGASYKRQNERNPDRGKERPVQSLKTSRDTSPSSSSAISASKTGATAPSFIDQTEEPESNTADGPELFEDSQLDSRSKAIASKTKEIEQIIFLPPFGSQPGTSELPVMESLPPQPLTPEVAALNLEKATHLSTAERPTRRRRPRKRPPPRAHPITWGDLKYLTTQAETMANQNPQTSGNPLSMFLIMCAIVTANSRALATPLNPH
ncbi:periphilin-1 isoform X3 [Nannospalax galili]|uniref:periphilin-1 isoform X3 n=1 Tax=Nannospalax galili TaxID=1026970 RepID=UPI00111C4A74|nr:periphilin-1 isoform X3 [Nannospalax galili]